MLSQNQYFNLELGCSFTSYELHSLYDAIFIAINHYNNINHKNTANSLIRLNLKVGKIIDKANTI